MIRSGASRISMRQMSGYAGPLKLVERLSNRRCSKRTIRRSSRSTQVSEARPGRAVNQSLLFAGDLKRVVYAEDAGNLVGPDSCHRKIAAAVDNAFQRHVAVFNDEVDGVPAERRIVGDAASLPGHAVSIHPRGRPAIRGVALQGTVAVDRRIDGGTDAVVIGRQRQDLDVVLNGLDAVDLLDGVFEAGLQDGAGCISAQNDRIAFDCKVDVVTDA